MHLKSIRDVFVPSCRKGETRIEVHTSHAYEPEMCITPIPPRPGGVARAYIVSCSEGLGGRCALDAGVRRGRGSGGHWTVRYRWEGFGFTVLVESVAEMTIGAGSPEDDWVRSKQRHRGQWHRLAWYGVLALKFRDSLRKHEDMAI